MLFLPARRSASTARSMNGAATTEAPRIEDGGSGSATPVQLASEQDWPQLQLLLQGGVACDAVDDHGRTALHYAAGYGEEAVVRALCEAGSDVNAADRAGMTPLHWACLKSHAATVDILLSDSRADAFVCATAGIFRGRCALDLADHAHNGAVREVLLRQLGASMFELRKVVGRGGYGCVVKAVRRDTGGTVALKAVRKAPAGASPHGTLPAQLTAALTERAVLSELSRRELAHPFVVQLQQAPHDDAAPCSPSPSPELGSNPGPNPGPGLKP